MATSKKYAPVTLILAALAFSPVAVAQTFVGVSTAKDGDSLVVDGQEVRLFGIDAPEFDQTCRRDGEPWECGQAAKAQLAALVKGQTVTCQRISTDAYGRALSKCYAGSDELNRTMVEQGWAVAYREFSLDYEREEALAHRNGLGIWSGEFQQPSDFRHSKEPQAKVKTKPARRPRAAPKASISGCVIKGNRNRRGEWIYHLPGMPYYDVTRPEEIFCSEAAAQDAGYRRAIVEQ